MSKKIGVIAIILAVMIMGGAVYFWPKPRAGPSTPTGLAATAPAIGQAKLDWDDNPENDLNHYNVYRSTSSEFECDNSTFLDNVLSSEYLDTGLGENVTYYYGVTAVNSRGEESNPSPSVSVTTLAGEPPTADFTFSPTSPWYTDTVTFDASQSSDPDGEIVNYEWDFGGYEGGDTGMIVDHVYSMFGLYEVTLTVTDDDGLSDNVTKEIKVRGSVYPGPVAEFTYSPSSPSVGENVTFDPSESEINYPSGWWENTIWDFGDNTTYSTQFPVEVTHSYPSPGEYEVTLTVVQNDFQTDNLTKTVTVMGVSRVLTVGEGMDYTTISEAIAAAEPGYTILVYPGTYEERLWMAKNNIEIRSVEGPDNTIIELGGMNLTITYSEHVTIDGFTVENGGIEVNFCEYVTISNNVCESNPQEKMSGSGIYVESSRHVTISNNICKLNNTHGILLRATEYSTIENNICKSNKAIGIALYGILLIPKGASNNVVKNNVCESNGGSGIMLHNISSNNLVENNVCESNNHGIFLNVESSNNVVKNNVCESNGGSGITIDKESSNNLVENNVCESNSTGIALGVDTENISIHYNNIVGNDIGIKNTNLSELTDATNNWWGDSTGPYHPTLNPDGLGDVVSDNVEFVPWLDAPYPGGPNYPPVADANGPYTVNENETVLLNGMASSDPDGTIVSYSWVITSGPGSLDNANTATPTFNAPLVDEDTTATVELEVTDDDGATDTDTATVNIVNVPVSVNQPPVADFSWSPVSPTVMETVQFTDLSSDPDGSVVSWLWEFGDEVTSENQSPTHQYADDGTYTVTLVATDNDGATDNVSKDITVVVGPKVLTVGVGMDYATISEAIAAAESGNTILVYPGTYTESVKIAKPNLTIRSAEGPETTVVTESGVYVFTIAAYGVTIDGFTCEGATVGIKVFGKENAVISNNICRSNDKGIALLNSANNNVVDHNRCENNALRGISVSGSSNNEISNNTCRSNLKGIVLEAMADNNVVYRNTCENNADQGIWVTASSNNKISHNICRSNMAGVAILNSPGNAADNNTVESNGDFGISVKNSVDTQIHYNNIVGNTTFGIRNETPANAVDATSNWWGDASGPYHETNLGGLGDNVSDGVLFEPWLEVPWPGCPAWIGRIT